MPLEITFILFDSGSFICRQVPNQDLEYEDEDYDQESKPVRVKKHRVIDREDLQVLIPGFPGS